jgi:hypothetical protein
MTLGFKDKSKFLDFCNKEMPFFSNLKISYNGFSESVSKTDLTKLVIPTLFAEHDKVLLDVEAVTKLINSAHDFGVATGRRVQQILSRDQA